MAYLDNIKGDYIKKNKKNLYTGIYPDDINYRTPALQKITGNSLFVWCQDLESEETLILLVDSIDALSYQTFILFPFSDMLYRDFFYGKPLP